MYSLVIPVYRNEDTLPLLLEELEGVDAELDRNLEVVFVVDGSPDGSLELLRESLPKCTFSSRLITLSRTFGSFEAVRAGLAEAEGPYFAILSADLQEPPGLAPEFFHALEREPVDVVIGIRSKRDDPLLSRGSAAVFWRLFRFFVQDEIPPGGVDVFGCNRAVRDQLLALEERNTSLVSQLFWLGFRRKLIPYPRNPRMHGESDWTWRMKLRYASERAK